MKKEGILIKMWIKKMHFKKSYCFIENLTFVLIYYNYALFKRDPENIIEVIVTK